MGECSNAGFSVLSRPVSNSQQHPQHRAHHPEPGRPLGWRLVSGRGVGGSGGGGEAFLF